MAKHDIDPNMYGHLQAARAVVEAGLGELQPDGTLRLIEGLGHDAMEIYNHTVSPLPTEAPTDNNQMEGSN